MGTISVRNSGLRRYKRLKAAGLCIKCGRNNAVEGIVLCLECKKRDFERRKGNKKFCVGGKKEKIQAFLK